MITINRLRPRTLGTAAALATLATCAFLPATAQAAVHPADGTGTTNTSTPLFASPSSSGGSEITLRSGYSLDLHCWVDGGWYDGTNRWFEAAMVIPDFGPCRWRVGRGGQEGQVGLWRARGCGPAASGPHTT